MKMLDAIINWLDKYGGPIWYILLLVLSIIYVALNFCNFVTSEVLEEFTGSHIIFIACLALLVSPVFDTFEGFGIKLTKRKKERMDKELGELSQNVRIRSNGDVTVENLEAELREVEHKEKK